eukprot:12542949-Ditylum_brightwellii.AAC.1
MRETQDDYTNQRQRQHQGQGRMLEESSQQSYTKHARSNNSPVEDMLDAQKMLEDDFSEETHAVD